MPLFKRKNKRKYYRKENPAIYINLLNDIENSLGAYIISKSVISEEFIEYKLHFKSDHIEFELYFDSNFIAYINASIKLNHYHFNSWTSKEFDNQEVIKELKRLLEGKVLFADIFKNDKFYNVWYEDLSYYTNINLKDLDKIVDEFFNENGFPKGDYNLKLHGNKIYNGLEINYKNEKRTF